MSGPIFWLPVVKISWGKNSKKKPILLVNFCFLTHFDILNTRIFSFSIGGKVMNPKMPLCQHIKYLMNHPFKGIEAVDNKEEDDPIYDSN